MNGVIGLSEYLKEHVESTELKTVADGLIETGKRLSNSLTSILELAEHESKLKEIEMDHFKPELLVYECLTNFQVEIEQKGLELEVTNFAGDQFISSNQRYFVRILDSLVDNAVKYTEKGRIKIELNRDIAAGHPTFAVRVYDTGIGIKEVELQGIFNAFQTSADQMTRGYEGLGIGLTVARKYAELLGGEISVDSRLGQGSVFTLRLPLHT
jgi:signal transduction histidine kinase